MRTTHQLLGTNQLNQILYEPDQRFLHYLHDHFHKLLEQVTSN